MSDTFVITHRPDPKLRAQMREIHSKRYAEFREGYLKRLTPEYQEFLEGEVARLLRNTNASQR